MNPILSSPAWQELGREAERWQALTLREAFAHDPARFSRLSRRWRDWLLDLSKQRLDARILAFCGELWSQADVPGWIARMRAGETINHTEGRAVLHIALREAQPRAEVAAVLAKMRAFCADVHAGRWRGATGEPITDVVNIGIGGSDLGPRMATQALAAYRLPHLRVHYVANVDGADLATTLASLRPEHTLFIVASKTFTTQETMQNALSARAWLASALNEAAVARHFVAVSTALDKVAAFGIDPAHAFAFWEWVGGRFSLWSAIGLPLALAIGYERFAEMLAGARAMDEHFFTTPPDENLPALLAFVDLWNTDFLGICTRAVLPYSHSLGLLPRYLQQLEMESLGKRIDRDGEETAYATQSIVWGEPGTNGQHAFYQLLHQGTLSAACEFIAVRKADFPLAGHQEKLLANCFAQSAALMWGKSESEARAELAAAGAQASLAPYKTFPGNRPSTTLLLPRLDPFELGALIALYEHKVFVLGCLWHINAFDQWGVEYGKEIAGRLLPMLEGKAPIGGVDPSTAGLLEACRQ
ncbi:MAG: glucose-6-phosphate isomerase [Rhodocyclaceae bacterium]|nr:glucose-6-phosphate isomerase [Rhodocyclaceae bacterium]